MELDAYVKALVRRWYVPLTLVAVAIVGVMIYHGVTSTKTAEAKLVVIQPVRPSPGEYIPPQVPFDSLNDSRALAERVATRLNDGTTADEVAGKISIAIRRSPNRSAIQVIRAKDANGDRARLIADITVEEAQKLYAELNQPDGADVRAAFDGEIARAESVLTSARDALAAFERDNDAFALDARLEQQIVLIAQLRGQAHVLGSSQAVRSPSNGGQTLSSARAEFDRLTALQPEYDRLFFEAELAHSAVARIESRRSELELAPASAAVNRALAEADALLVDANTRASQADEALAAFRRANGVSNPASEAATQLEIINGAALATASSGAGAGVVSAAIAEEEAEMERLAALEPEHTRLTLELRKAEEALSTIEERIIDVIAGRVLPAEAQVKLLDNARIQSNLWWVMLTYALAVAIALFVSLSAVYLLAYFERVPPSIQELEREFGLPVIASVPKAAG